MTAVVLTRLRLETLQNPAAVGRVTADPPQSP